jgi:hypothetical protein
MSRSVCPVLEAHFPQPNATSFILYRRDPKAGRLLSREAWIHDDHVVDHWGTYGERGDVRGHPAADEAARVLARRARGRLPADAAKPDEDATGTMEIADCRGGLRYREGSTLTQDEGDSDGGLCRDGTRPAMVLRYGVDR